MVCGLQSPILASQLQPPIFITIIIIIIAIIAIIVTILLLSILNLSVDKWWTITKHSGGHRLPDPKLVHFWSFSVKGNFGHFLSDEIAIYAGRALLQKSEVWTVWLACDEGGVEIIAHQLLLFCAQSRVGKGQIEVQVLFHFSAILIDFTCLTLLPETCCLERTIMLAFLAP